MTGQLRNSGRLQNKVKVGMLYRVGFKWLLPKWDIHEVDFSKTETILYLGTDEKKRGSRHHQVLADGELVNVDDDFLRLLKPVG